MTAHRAVVAGLSALALAAGLAGPAAAQKTVTVVGKEFKFKPDTVELAPGETLVIEFKNEGALSHNMTFKQLDAKTGTIQAGGSARLEVQPEPGTYTFICTVPGHAPAGMKGKLVVK